MLTLLGVFTVVLIFVWVITPLFAPGVWPLLDSAETSSGRRAPQTERDVFISLTASGELFVDEEKVSPDALTAALRRSQSTQTVFVRVDRHARFEAVRSVVRAAQAAQRQQLTFLATPTSRADMLWE